MPRYKITLLSMAAATVTFAFPYESAAFERERLDKAINQTSENTQIQRFISINSNDDEVVNGARSFVENIATRGIGFLSNKELSEEQRTKEFRKLLQDSFDMKTIGRFALGRYWKTTTDSEKKEYLKLFEEMIVSVYSRRFSDYHGHKLEVDGAIATGKSDAIVSSLIVPESGPKVSVEWRIRYKDGKYKVVDIIVEKVSMSLTQRSDFASVIQRGGGQVEVLLAHLRQEDEGK